MDTPNDWKPQVQDLMNQAWRSKGKSGRPKAVKLYHEALSLIPEPVEENLYTNLIHTALGEMYFLADELQNAFDSFIRAKACRGGEESSHISFRLGQIYYEQGNMERAREELAHAYRLTEGREFEQEHFKYYDLIKDEPGIGPRSISSRWPELVRRLIKRAERQEEKGQSAAAIDLYHQALFMIPEPIEDYGQSTRVFTALGERCFLDGELEASFDYYSRAVRSKGGLGRPHIHLRLGELRYERGEMERARDELMRAYIGEGEDIFKGEDPKYYDLIRDVIEQDRS